MHCILLQIAHVGKLQHVIFASFKAVILLACVILIRCDALSKESAMPADDLIPACVIAFVQSDPCKKFLYILATVLCVTLFSCRTTARTYYSYRRL